MQTTMSGEVHKRIPSEIHYAENFCKATFKTGLFSDCTNTIFAQAGQLLLVRIFLTHFSAVNFTLETHIL